MKASLVYTLSTFKALSDGVRRDRDIAASRTVARVLWRMSVDDWFGDVSKNKEKSSTTGHTDADGPILVGERMDAVKARDDVICSAMRNLFHYEPVSTFQSSIFNPKAIPGWDVHTAIV